MPTAVNEKSFETVKFYRENLKCFFPLGIIGFPESRNYEIDSDQRFYPFLKLKSLDEPGVEFAVIDPWIIKKDYHVEICDSDLESLETQSAEDLIIFSIVTFYPEESKICLNLLAPLVINFKKRIGTQIILSDESLPIRFYVDFKNKE